MSLKTDPILRAAVALGYEIHQGGRHYHAIHSATGNCVIISRGRQWQHKIRNVRNVLAALKRGARLTPD